jgi:amino acid transporter
LIGSVLICGGLYFLLQLAFLGSVPSSAVAKGGWANVGLNFPAATGGATAQFAPLAAIASIIGLGWLAVMLYADAIISPSDTGLIYLSVTARLSYAVGRNRNAPAGLAAVNRKGVPWVSLILAFIVGCIFFLPFPSWQELVGIVTTMTVLSFGSGPIALLTLRRQIPDVERPFRLRGAWVIASLALLSTNMILYWSGWDQIWKMMVAIVLGYILLAIFQFRDNGYAPPLDFQHGWWVLVWFAGVTVVSYLGSYSGTSATNSGQRNVIGFDASIIVNIVLTAIVLALAYISRLPGDRVEHIIAHRDDTDDVQPATS